MRPAASLLAELGARAATPELIRILTSGGTVTITQQPYLKDDKTLEDWYPTFALLVELGDTAVPAIRTRLEMANWDQTYLLLRVLKAIGTPEAAGALRKYIADYEANEKILKNKFGSSPEN